MILFIYSCGIQRLAIDHADNLLTYQVTRKIPLYSEQKKKLEADLEKFLNRSKVSVSDILPALDTIELKGTEEVDRLYPKIEAFYMNLATNFSQLLSVYMAELDSKQQKEMFEEIDDENRDLLKKEKEDRLDELEDRFKNFFGMITGPQKQLLIKNADYFQERAKKRLDRRVKLLEKLKEIYRQDQSLESRKESINSVFKDYQREAMSGHRTIEIIKEFLPTLSKTQKEHFRQHVEDIKELLKYFLKVDY
jgi:F0F1-type ATP synthase delta subunit